MKVFTIFQQLIRYLSHCSTTGSFLTSQERIKTIRMLKPCDFCSPLLLNFYIIKDQISSNFRIRLRFFMIQSPYVSPVLYKVLGTNIEKSFPEASGTEDLSSRALFLISLLNNTLNDRVHSHSFLSFRFFLRFLTPYFPH